MAYGYVTCDGPYRGPVAGYRGNEVVAAPEAGSTERLAWSELIEALTLLARGKTEGGVLPCYCQHDLLTVLSDPDAFTGDELDQLAAWGFHPDGLGGFYSFRFGSA